MSNRKQTIKNPSDRMMSTTSTFPTKTHANNVVANQDAKSWRKAIEQTNLDDSQDGDDQDGEWTQASSKHSKKSDKADRADRNNGYVKHSDRKASSSFSQSRGGYKGHPGAGKQLSQKKRNPTLKDLARQRVSIACTKCENALKFGQSFDEIDVDPDEHENVKDPLKINLLTLDNIRDVIDEVRIELKLPESEHKTVQATVLGVMVKYMAHLKSGHVDLITRISPLINELKASNSRESKEKHTIDSAEAQSQVEKSTSSAGEKKVPFKKTIVSKTKEELNAMGYDLLNNATWPGNLGKIVNVNGYVDGVETLINVCGCNVLAENARGENALKSYLHGITKGYSIDNPRMRVLLETSFTTDGLKKMVCEVVNKLSSTKATKFGNRVKILVCYAKEILAKSIVESFFPIGNGDRQFGVYTTVCDRLQACKIAIEAPITEDENAPILEKVFTSKSKINKSNALNLLLRDCVEYAISLFPEKRKYLESLSEEEKNKIGIDTIGGLIGSSTVILRDPKLYLDFINKMALELESEFNQNQIYVATSHLLDFLTRYKIVVADMTRFISPEALQFLAKLNSVFVRRVTINMELSMNKFLGYNVFLKDFGELAKKYPVKQNPSSSSSLQDTKDTAHTSMKSTVTSKFSVLSTEDDESEGHEASDEQTEDIEESKRVDYSSILSKEKGKKFLPTWLKNIDISSVSKKGDEWTPPQVDDWVYSIGKLDKTDNSLINGIIFEVMNNSIRPNNMPLERVKLFKEVLDDAFSSDVVADALNTLVELSKSDKHFVDFWETSKNHTYFQELVKLYKIES